MGNRTKLLTAAAIVAALTPAAFAGEFQVSGGGEYLFDSADSEFAFTGVTARGTYYINETIGFEAEATAGTSGADNYGGTGVDFSLESQFGGYVVARGKTGERGEFFGRIGFRAGSIEANDTFSNFNQSFDYNGFSLGGGYTHFLNDTMGLRGEITTSGASLDGNFDPDGNLTSFAVSLVAKF